MTMKYAIDGEGVNPGQLSIFLKDENQELLVWKANFETGGMIEQKINLKSDNNFAIVLHAQRENSAGGTVSIDNILFTEEECPSNPNNCDFEEASVCGYQNEFDSENVVAWAWGSGSVNSGNGPDIDHSTGTAEGHFLYIDGAANGTEAGSSGHLSSPILRGNTCGELWLHMGGEGAGQLNVYQTQPGQPNILKWTRQGGQDRRWETTRFQLDDVPEYQLKFEVFIDTPGANHIAIDDVKTLDINCVSPGACDFDNQYCSWTNEDTDSADWLLHDNFIWLDNKAGAGKDAAITSMMFPATESPRCATFQYLIQGTNPGDCISFNKWTWGGEYEVLWRLCNFQDERWAEGKFPIVSEDTQYFLTLIGTTGEGSTLAENAIRIKLLEYSSTTHICDIQPARADPSVTTTPVPTTSTTTAWLPSTTTVNYNDVGDCNFEHEMCNWEVFTGALYLGCFDDHTRLLDKKIYSNNSNSPDLCMRGCKAEGFSFSGLQYGGECFCGNQDPPVCLRKPEEECDMKCPGNEEEFCGGNRKMNIYKQGVDWQLRVASESNHVPDKDHTSNSADGHYVDLLPLPSSHDRTQTYVGCFIDTGDRLLDELMYRDNNNTVERCQAACRDQHFLLSGVQAS